MERAVYRRMRDIEGEHWWFAARRRILGEVIAGLDLPPSSQVLEAGCGAGGNLTLLAQFGAVTGMEPDAESRAYAQEATGILVVDGALPADIPFDDGQFDLIAALDMIEHVEDDVGAVSTLSRLLKPQGFILATVPANPWMWSGHDAAHHHHRRYTMKSYRRLFDLAGLKVRKASHFNSLLFPAIAATRLAKRALRLGGDEDRLGARGVNRLLGAVFASERHWLRGGGFPFGVSLLVVAQKD